MATSLSEDFRTEVVGTRPAGWTRAGDDATNALAWLIENQGGGQPNDLRLGDITDTGRIDSFLAPTGVGGKLGLIRATFKHYQLRAGFAESSAGLGVSTGYRGGTNQASGLFISGSVNVNSGQYSIGMRIVNTDGSVGFPANSFVTTFASLTPDTSITMELERNAISTLRFRAYLTGGTLPAWTTYILDSTQQLLSGPAALHYRHNNGNTISNARYETFEFIQADNPATPTVTASIVGYAVTANGSSFSSPISGTHAATQARLVQGFSVVSTQTGVGTGPFVFTAPLSDTTYAVEMRYQDNVGNWSEWGRSSNVTTPPAPRVPVVTISDVLTVAGRITGSAFIAAGRTHSDSQFRVLREDTTIAYDSGTGLGPVLTAYATGLTSGTRYTAQVRYRDDLLVWGEWGEETLQTRPGDALITDYATLRRALARWLNRRDLEEDIPVFIQLAENKLRRDSRCKVLVSDTPTITTDGMSLPSAMKLLEGWFHDGPVNFGPLEVVAYNELPGLKAQYGQTGIPRYVALVGSTAYFVPEPDGSYATKRAYWAMPTPLSDASPTNTLILDQPDIYLYAALCESAPYLKEDPRLMTWASELETRLTQMDLAAWHKQFGGAVRERFRPIGG